MNNRPLQTITDPISGPSFDFTFTIGPELDNYIIIKWTVPGVATLYQGYCETQQPGPGSAGEVGECPGA